MIIFSDVWPSRLKSSLQWLRSVSQSTSMKDDKQLANELNSAYLRQKQLGKLRYLKDGKLWKGDVGAEALTFLTDYRTTDGNPIRVLCQAHQRAKCAWFGLIFDIIYPSLRLEDELCQKTFVAAFANTDVKEAWLGNFLDLHNYIENTLIRAIEENKSLYTEGKIIFNTTLKDINGKELYIIADESSCYLRQFTNPRVYTEDDVSIVTVLPNGLPPVAYYNDDDEIAFKNQLSIELNWSHLLVDNRHRLLATSNNFSDADVKKAALHAINLVSKGDLIPQPQYCRSQKKIQFLIPLSIAENNQASIVIILDETTQNGNSLYIGRTWIPVNKALCNARLLTRITPKW